MAFQGYSCERGIVHQLAKVEGAALIGTKVRAPLSKYEQVYVLPMENVLATKGTGVVSSVPSDSPDDYTALQDLKKKFTYYKIDPSWADFDPTPIINTPTYGDLVAPAVCKLKKINSQKDRVQLAEAKDIAYKEGFYNGTMLVGDFKGKP
ncbi:8001_t:CDS:1, partial [Scutellospora calospora]